jgi:hypothetical protein
MEKKQNKGAQVMAHSEAHKAWMKENTVVISIRLQKNSDAAILAYLDGKNKQGEIKRALRLLIETEKEKAGE